MELLPLAQFLFEEAVYEDHFVRVNVAYHVPSGSRYWVKSFQRPLSLNALVDRVAYLAEHLSHARFWLMPEAVMQARSSVYTAVRRERTSGHRPLSERLLADDRAFMDVVAALADMVYDCHRHDVFHHHWLQARIWFDPQHRTVLVDGLEYRVLDQADDPELRQANNPTLADGLGDLRLLGLRLIREMVKGQGPTLSTSEVKISPEALAPMLSERFPDESALAEILRKLVSAGDRFGYRSGFDFLLDVKRTMGLLRQRSGAALVVPADVEVERWRHVDLSLARPRLRRLIAKLFRRRPSGLTILEVSGQPGSGKTALLRHLQSSARDRHLRVLDFRTDVVSPPRPMELVSLLIEEGLVLLSASNHGDWDRIRNRISQEAGYFWNRLIDRIPGLDLLNDGSQPSVGESSFGEDQLHTVFRNLLEAVVTHLPPALIVVDSPQRVDSGSLQCLIDLQDDLPGWYLACSRGSQEAASPLLDRSKRTHRFSLKPLTRNETAHFIARVLEKPLADADPFTAQFHRWGHRTPGAVLDILRHMYRDHALQLAGDHSAWLWDKGWTPPEAPSRQRFGTALAELALVPEDVLRTLVVAACLGDLFTVELLLLGREDDDIVAHHVNWLETVGLIGSLESDERPLSLVGIREPIDLYGSLGTGELWQFIDPQTRAGVMNLKHVATAEIHLHIALRLLHEARVEACPAETIAKHLLLGDARKHRRKHPRLMALNTARVLREAACHHLDLMAFDQAEACLELALNLSEETDREHRDIRFELGAELGVILYLKNERGPSRRLFERLERQAPSPAHRARILLRRFRLYHQCGELSEAVTFGLKVLKFHGFEILEDPERMARAIRRLEREIESWLASEDTRAGQVRIGPDTLPIRELVILEMFPQVFNADSDLWEYLILQLFHTQHIAEKIGSKAYVCSLTAWRFGIRGDIPTAIRLGKTSLQMLKREEERGEARFSHQVKFAAAIQWYAFDQGLPGVAVLLKSAYRQAHEGRDWAFCNFILEWHASLAFLRGDPLNTLLDLATEQIEFAEKTRNHDLASAGRVSKHLWSLCADHPPAIDSEPTWQTSIDDLREKGYRGLVGWLLLRGFVVHVLLGRTGQAITLFEEVKSYERFLHGTILEPIYYVFAAYCLVAEDCRDRQAHAFLQTARHTLERWKNGGVAECHCMCLLLTALQAGLDRQPPPFDTLFECLRQAGLQGLTYVESLCSRMLATAFQRQDQTRNHAFFDQRAQQVLAVWGGGEVIRQTGKSTEAPPEEPQTATIPLPRPPFQAWVDILSLENLGVGERIEYLLQAAASSQPASRLLLAMYRDAGRTRFNPSGGQSRVFRAGPSRKEVPWTFLQEASFFNHDLIVADSRQSPHCLSDPYFAQVEPMHLELVHAQNHRGTRGFLYIERPQGAEPPNTRPFNRLVCQLILQLYGVDAFRLASPSEDGDHGHRAFPEGLGPVLSRPSSPRDYQRCLRAIFDLLRDEDRFDGRDSLSRRVYCLVKETLNRVPDESTREENAANAPFLHAGVLFPSLSPTEVAVCNHLKNNLSSKEVAEKMNVSPFTIETHRRRIRKKLQLNRNQNLTSYLMNKLRRHPS
ncbi:AAA family ATPase [Sulfidibacter corallicola]|uniref:AAA family ATPase n=1 Tax=Sulfidibacter corallicola TaxID=2818388 RepID=A0A8A4TGG3_SULCO|nr:AAA family ATPase [Sulfidibacter corallicola]QTD48733.1 AAA family ATPase [Sulfidibacter corallicola]